MTIDEFNKKYAAFLKEGHYGLAIDHADVVLYLDELFQELTKRPGFYFTQIKLKFGMARFYAEPLVASEQYEIEKKIDNLLRD